MKRRFGFTLVELIIVIAIIGLLFAFLLPALARARKQARVIQCASNIRQIAQALTFYTGDNKNWLPGSDIKDPYWWHYLGGCQYYSGTTIPFRYTPIVRYDFSADSNTIWTCPFVPIELEGLVGIANYGLDNWSNHYALNKNVSGKPMKYSFRQDLPLLADGAPIANLGLTGTVANPSSFKLAGCYFTYKYSYPPLNWLSVLAPWPINRSGPAAGRATTLHGGGFSVAWPDGHVTLETSVSQSQLVYP